MIAWTEARERDRPRADSLGAVGPGGTVIRAVAHVVAGDRGAAGVVGGRPVHRQAVCRARDGRYCRAGRRPGQARGGGDDSSICSYGCAAAAHVDGAHFERVCGAVGQPGFRQGLGTRRVGSVVTVGLCFSTGAKCVVVTNDGRTAVAGRRVPAEGQLRGSGHSGQVQRYAGCGPRYPVGWGFIFPFLRLRRCPGSDADRG